MSTCRFVVTNLAETATVKNGTGGSPTPPARSEVSPFVMERALNADRRSLWKCGAQNAIGTTGWQKDLDLGSAKLVQAAAVHGISCPGGAITSVWIGYIDDSVYPSSNYVPVQALAANGRDYGVVLTNALTKRWWFLLVDATAAPLIGRVVLGALTDVGAPNPGAEASPVQNRIEQVGADGSLTLNTLGPPGQDIVLSFDPCLNATRDALHAVCAHPGTLSYFGSDGKCLEVFARRGRPATAGVNSRMSSVALELARVS